MARLGAHLSVAGGNTKALEKIVAIGGKCLQIFASSPRGWNSPNATPEEIKTFRELRETLKVNPVYFHACYLINLADSEDVGRKSKKNLIAELNYAAKLGVRGSIIHLGSFKDEKEKSELPPEVVAKKYQVLIDNIKEVLAATPPEVLFIIENAGTRKIGLTINEISNIIRDVNDERVRVCFDTCHLHAAGYNLSTQENVDAFLNTFDTYVGINKLELIHMNDSKDPFDSRRDRHENIGQGNVGLEVFRLLLNHPLTQKASFIIETPGFDEQGPDKENLDILKGLISKNED